MYTPIIFVEIKSCKPLTVPKHGTMQCSMVDGQMMCQSWCERGYKPRGSSNRICVNGVWDGEEAFCIRKYIILKYIEMKENVNMTTGPQYRLLKRQKIKLR